MKNVFIAIITTALFLLPPAVYAQSDQSSKEAPPVSQVLVAEGDFALKLAPALGLGTPNSEAEAEDMLTSVGIAPKNGWIADYPITPIVIGDLQNAVTGAADAHKLPIGKDDALTALRNLTVEFGLAVTPGGSGQYAGNQPQPDPGVIDNYYYEEGPPVVTYYPPPWDYNYLYAWVPYPFWWGGFFFSGFFCLHDFHRFAFVGHHNHLISNHFINPVTHAVARVNPVSHTASTRVPRTTAFDSRATRNAASSIFNRNVNSGGSRAFSHTNASSTSSGMSHRSSQSFGRSSSSPSTGTRSSGSFESSGRTLSTPGRSSNSPSSGGSLSCANCHGSSGSFGHSAGGGRSGGISSGHSSGGFSGSHSSGGFSGGHSSGGGFSGGHGGGGGRGR
jgi:hypothetical protein